MLKLNNQQLKFLRARAHSLKPVVMIASNGLSENVLLAIEEALEYHELIKIKLRTEEREQKAELIDKICKKTRSGKVQVIGHVLVIYRPAKKPKLVIQF